MSKKKITVEELHQSIAEYYNEQDENYSSDQLEIEDVDPSMIAELFEEGDADAVLSVGYAESVDSYGGEGQGDDLWFVIKIGDQHFQMSGYYSSNCGGTWDDGFEEVIPEIVPKTVWRNK